MHIKEIVVDGFKSYAQQTTIGLFDPHFNAITGLNGSGKSNILDAICFVLGISNLSQVRATHLQELIYKGGNAGVTKATVSITFDNMDKAQSPIGYHEYEEITITRQISVGNKHKYLINGQNATAQRVSDLFCSVQLNVNNPNFLIMQGKITKVLNMKPVEILSMIEEAAGTKTYDIKKENALVTIEKKNAKLNEIERVLREDITPVIEKLKLERSAYIEFQKCEREYQHLHKITLAHQYYQHEQLVNKNKSQTDDIEREFNMGKERIELIEERVVDLKTEITEYMKKLKETQNDETMNKLEEELKQNRMSLTKLNSDLSHLNSNTKSDNKRIDQIKKSIKENEKIIETKQASLNDMKANVDTVEKDLAECENNLKRAQQEYEALCCGLVLDEGTSQMQTIQDQLLNTKGKITEHKTAIQKAQLKLNNAVKENDKLKKELDKESAAFDDKQQAYNKQKIVVDKIRGDLDALNFDADHFASLTTKRRDLNKEIYQLNDVVQEFYNRFPQVNFEYQDPQPNFDRTKVKGLVCNLFKIKDPKFATALEVAAGSKLYNLVVDTDQTGKLILQNGQLRRKVTIIPMNQIRPYTLPDSSVKSAKSLVGADNVYTALSLIDYDPIYKPVMEFVFGSKLVCYSLEAAKSVAFHPSVMASTITLDGDQFDPEGTLTGGARAERSNLLQKLNELRVNKNELDAKSNELERLDAELNKERERSQRYAKIKNELDMQTNQLNLAKTNLEQTSQHQKLERSNALTKEIEQQREEIEKSTKELESLTVKLAELEEKAKNKESKNVEQEKKLAQKKIQEAKQTLEKKQKSSGQFQQDYKSITIEIEVLNKEIADFNQEIAKLTQNLESYAQSSIDINKQIEKLKEAEEEINGQLEEHKEVVREKNRVIDSKSKECDKLNKEKNGIELKLKELEHKKTSLSEQLAQSIRQLERILDEHEWISEEKEMFNKANTVYDFSRMNMKEMHHRLNDIKHRKDQLSKQVDIRAMGLLAKKEEEYEELNKKRTIVLKDRSTLETTIEDLEKIKTETLNNAFTSINKDLGNIFKTLLPGAFAKLVYVNKSSLLDGVEFKVAFGDVWKESLTELSGGQRSLVALSLILSLLLYKPAPLYILDEVDAALDTSHTQNIGLMIKKYFKASQFVIVSLKDGMFNNANVLFRTKLIEGVSTIQRFEQKRKQHQQHENYTALNDQTNIRVA